MVQAWYLDDSNEDEQLPHKTVPPQYVTAEELYQLSGVESFQMKVDGSEPDPCLTKLRKERGYSYEDEFTCCPKKLPNFEEMLKAFYKEHLHADDEIRLVLEGSGYFDVRDGEERWIRILAKKGDLLVMPAGLYHRFTLDSDNYIRASRYFIGNPVWTAHYRPAADDLPCRSKYVTKLTSGFFKPGLLK